MIRKLVIQDSWLAYNPVEGCSGDCIYCFQKPKGKTGIVPGVVNNNIDEEYDEVINYYYKYYTKTPNCCGESVNTPIAIGTEADMFDVHNIKFLYDFLDIHVKCGSNIPIVIITKKEIPDVFIEKYGNVSFPIFLIVSASLLPENFEKGNLSLNNRLEMAKSLRVRINKSSIRNIFLIHNWRPFINTAALLNKDMFVEMIKQIFDCSILIGLRVTNAMYLQICNQPENPLFQIVDKIIKNNKNYFDGDAKEILDYTLSEVFNFAQDYPVFRNTSCAISYLLGKVDYTGTMWRNDICPETVCPETCIERCKKYIQNWNSKKLQGIEYSCIEREDCVELQEFVEYEATIALTHRYGKPVYMPEQTQKMEWFCGNYRYFNEKYHS